MKILFDEEAWIEFMEWTMRDNKTTKRINDLIKDIQRNGLLKGMGNPEILKYQNDREVYSRRIDSKNRLTYELDTNGNLNILQCRGHYND
ncbi:MAG: Txe/YoeB family addiction module toxin [Oscillospiraceae bacterium]|nr:Txe/YoeB family addiction module toxin [Oscillospiraceae bacterium]